MTSKNIEKLIEDFKAAGFTSQTARVSKTKDFYHLNGNGFDFTVWENLINGGARRDLVIGTYLNIKNLHRMADFTHFLLEYGMKYNYGRLVMNKAENVNILKQLGFVQHDIEHEDYYKILK